MNAMEETYKDVEGMIYRAAWKMVRRYGGDLNEYVSAGNLAFVEAYHTWDPNKDASFSTWLWWRIKGVMTHTIHRNTYRRDPNVCVNRMERRPPFDIERFLKEVSEDAATVVRLLVDSPHDIYDLLHHTDIDEVVQEGLARQCGRLGWTMARVKETFSEIRDALL